MVAGFVRPSLTWTHAARREVQALPTCRSGGHPDVFSFFRSGFDEQWRGSPGRHEVLWCAIWMQEAYGSGCALDQPGLCLMVRASM